MAFIFIHSGALNRSETSLEALKIDLLFDIKVGGLLHSNSSIHGDDSCDCMTGLVWHMEFSSLIATHHCVFLFKHVPEEYECHPLLVLSICPV